VSGSASRAGGDCVPVYTNSATCLTANTALGTSRAARVCGLCVVAVRVRTTAGRAVNTSVTNVRRFMAGLKITNKQCLVLDPVCSFALSSAYSQSPVGRAYITCLPLSFLNHLSFRTEIKLLHWTDSKCLQNTIFNPCRRSVGTTPHARPTMGDQTLC